jgi:uncharacterized protein YjbI with pentapeptide repeats
MIVLKDTHGLTICQAPAEGFDLGPFLDAAADASGKRHPKLHDGTPVPDGYRSLGGADFRDLTHQLRRSGVANAITPDGRLDMRGWDLSKWNFSRASLINVDLSGARLVRAVLHAADLRGSRLPGADLSGAWMQDADFRGADMRNVTMLAANLEDGEADLPEALRDPGRRAGVRKSFPIGIKAKFDDAVMDCARISEANLTGAEFLRTKLRRSAVMDSEFACATFLETDASGSDLARNSLICNSAGHIKTDAAVLRANDYFRLSIPEMLGAAVSASRRRDLAAGLTEEMRDDLRISLTLGALARGLAMAATAHGVPPGLLAAMPGAAFLHVEELGCQAVEAAYGGVVRLGFGGSRLLEDTREWLIGKTGVLATGRHAEALGSAASAGGSGVAALKMDGAVFVVATGEDVNRLLRKAGLLDGQARWSMETARLERSAGGGYPDETAPAVVDMHRDGRMASHWRDAGGRKLRSVHYDRTGTPTKVCDHVTGSAYPAVDDPDPFFRARRAVLEDFKDGLVRSLAPCNARTHLAVVRRDGAVVIKCQAISDVDSTDGQPSVVKVM